MSERDQQWADLGFGLDDGAPEPEALEAPDPPGEPEDTTLELRRTTAERLFDRIGHRGFSRPRVAVSGRIFARYRVLDPWDPDPAEPEDPIALGPVSLKLGDRRQVAPHLKPPERKKKKSRAEQARQGSWRPRVPSASQTGSRPQPSAQPRPAPPPAPASDLAREFGARDQRQPLRKPIPMRPDAAAASTDGPAAGSSAAGSSAAGSSAAGSSAAGSSAAGSSAAGAPAPSQAGPSPAALPRPPLPKPQRATGGRFRLSSTETTGPVVKQVRRLDQVTAEEAAASDRDAPAEPPPRAKLPPMGDGLDDLFGMAAMGGRMSLGSRKKGEEDEG